LLLQVAKSEGLRMKSV